LDSNIIDSDLKEEFKRDFLDQLQEVERLLLKLEEEPDNLEHIRNVFRPFHTIKGNAGVIGEIEIQDISQLSESALDQVRQGQKKLSKNMIDAIFQSVDLIRAIVEKGSAQDFLIQITDLKDLLKSVITSESVEKEKDKIYKKSTSEYKLVLNPELSFGILDRLSKLDRQISHCKISRDFEPYLFDIFENVQALTSFFENITSMSQVISKLQYLESYLTVLNTSDISYSKTAWTLLNQITSDIIKIMYPVLVNSLEIGVCYFNPADTIEDLNRSIKWLGEKGKKAIMLNINRNKPPKIDEIKSLIQIKKNSKIPLAYIQRFFGHKQHWRDMELLLEEAIEIENSFWRALESLAKRF